MVVAWVGSGWYGFGWRHEVGWPYFTLYSERGAVWGTGAIAELYPPSEYPVALNYFRWEPPRAAFGEEYVWRWEPRQQPNTADAKFFVLPYWLPTLLFAVPAAWMWRVDVKRRRAVREGCCATCGYSLVGTPADKSCPECGTARA
jgi:hypothetical protein